MEGKSVCPFNIISVPDEGFFFHDAYSACHIHHLPYTLEITIFSQP